MKKFNNFLRGGHGVNGSVMALIGSLIMIIIVSKGCSLLLVPIMLFIYYTIIVVATGFTGDDN